MQNEKVSVSLTLTDIEGIIGYVLAYRNRLAWSAKEFSQCELDLKFWNGVLTVGEQTRLREEEAGEKTNDKREQRASTSSHTT